LVRTEAFISAHAKKGLQLCRQLEEVEGNANDGGDSDGDGGSDEYTGEIDETFVDALAENYYYDYENQARMFLEIS
jgi:hypothetical protein